jgi:hypothetical protein
MKEHTLARRLADVAGLNEVQLVVLREWDDSGQGRGRGGYLGEEVERVWRNRALLRVR